MVGRAAELAMMQATHSDADAVLTQKIFTIFPNTRHVSGSRDLHRAL